jgi:hypothetical protein
MEFCFVEIGYIIIKVHMLVVQVSGLYSQLPCKSAPKLLSCEQPIPVACFSDTHVFTGKAALLRAPNSTILVPPLLCTETAGR